MLSTEIANKVRDTTRESYSAVNHAVDAVMVELRSRPMFSISASTHLLGEPLLSAPAPHSDVLVWRHERIPRSALHASSRCSTR
jgi:hypothetical protein